MMEMEMQIIMAILSLTLLLWAEAACAQSATYSASVSVHKDLMSSDPLTENEVSEILDKASKMLKKSAGHADACNVALKLKGPVRTFKSHDTPAKVGKDDLDALHRVDADVPGVDFHVKIVEEIAEFCRFPGTRFAGCSFPPTFRSMIVVHPAKHIDRHSSPDHLQFMPKGTFPDHVLWAHEFGHLAGLGHRDERDPDGQKHGLMTPCRLDAQFPHDALDQVKVSREECSCLLSGPGFGPNGTCGVPGRANLQMQCNQ
jgi:hypothetical protein